MFEKKKNTVANKESCDTLIGMNTSIEGSVESEGTVRVDGKVKGDMKISGDLYIGNDAVVTGNINAENIHLSGTVEGNIHSAGFLRLLSTARLYGDIQVHSFITDEGAIFQGKCSMLDLPSEQKAEKPGRKGKDYKKSAVLDQVYEEMEAKKEA